MAPFAREIPPEETRGLRYALYGFLGALAVFLLIILPPGAPLRNEETGAIFGDSPFMTGILVIISVLIGGAAGGFAGALLAVPIAAVGEMSLSTWAWIAAVTAGWW